MFNPFVCGSFHEEEDHDPCDHPTSSTPRRSSRSSSRSLNKNNKNPYSTRGLDKFSSLVDDLEERRQKIYQQMGSQDISFVRFVHSKADDWVPIVVKMRIHQQDNKVRLVGSKFKPVSQTNSKEAFHKFQIESPEPNNVHLQPRPVLSDERTSTAKKKSFSWNMKLMDRWGRSSNYLPIILVLILLCLVMFGRSVTILCTTCWWYLMPMIEGGHSNLRSALKKKDNATRLTEKKIASDGISSPKRKHMETIKD